MPGLTHVRNGGGDMTHLKIPTSAGWETVYPPPFVTTLPASPQEGDELYFLADSTFGVLWHLRYSTSDSCWHYVGGPEIWQQILPGETDFTPGVFGNLPTIGPTITIPYLGDYFISFDVQVSQPSAGLNAYVGISVNGATPEARYTRGVTMGGANFVAALGLKTVMTNLSRNSTVGLKYQINAGNATFAYRTLFVVPVRFYS